MQERINGKWKEVSDGKGNMPERHTDCAVKVPMTNIIGAAFGEIDFLCTELSTGELVMEIQGEQMGINYCPICGYKAKKRI